MLRTSVLFLALAAVTIAQDIVDKEDGKQPGRLFAVKQRHYSPTIINPGTPGVSILQRAHGTIMGIAVVLMFPFGALTVVSMFLLTAGFGIGVNMAKRLNIIYRPPAKHHTIFGTVLFALFWVQPFFGLAHHYLFMKKQSRTAVSYVHIWYGRALFIMAMVNGGLGLQLAATLGYRTIVGEIAYGVVAGFVGLMYICGASFGEWRRWAAEKSRSSGGASAEE